MLSKSEYVLPEDIIVLRRDNLVRFIWNGKIIADGQLQDGLSEYDIQTGIDETRSELADDLNEFISRGLPIMPSAPDYLPDWTS